MFSWSVQMSTSRGVLLLFVVFHYLHPRVSAVVCLSLPPPSFTAYSLFFFGFPGQMIFFLFFYFEKYWRKFFFSSHHHCILQLIRSSCSSTSFSLTEFAPPCLPPPLPLTPCAPCLQSLHPPRPPPLSVY